MFSHGYTVAAQQRETLVFKHFCGMELSGGVGLCQVGFPVCPSLVRRRYRLLSNRRQCASTQAPPFRSPHSPSAPGKPSRVSPGQASTPRARRACGRPAAGLVRVVARQPSRNVQSQSLARAQLGFGRPQDAAGHRRRGRVAASCRHHHRPRRLDVDSQERQ